MQAAAPKPVVKKAAPVGSGRFAISEGNAWDVEGASWAVNGGIFGRIGDGQLMYHISFARRLDRVGFR